MIPQGSFNELEHSRDRMLADQTRTHIHLTMAEVKRNLALISRLVAIVCMVLATLTLMAGLWEVHLMRRTRVAELEQFTRLGEGLLDKLASLGWKMDTQGSATTTMARNIRDAVGLVRVQLHENTRVTAKAATASTQIAVEAARSIAATTQIADKIVAAADAPAIKMEAPKTTVLPVVVPQAPAPVNTAPSVTPASPDTPERGGFKHAVKKLICPWCEHGRRTE